ncbi:fimbria/pilus outer membrane usher protein [Escherichia coli]
MANSTGLKTDWRGYTVVPYATSYRENRIALDAASLKRNVDLENAVVNVVPTKGRWFWRSSMPMREQGY